MVLKFSCKCFGGKFFEGWGNFGPDCRTSYIYCKIIKAKQLPLYFHYLVLFCPFVGAYSQPLFLVPCADLQLLTVLFLGKCCLFTHCLLRMHCRKVCSFGSVYYTVCLFLFFFQFMCIAPDEYLV